MLKLIPTLNLPVMKQAKKANLENWTPEDIQFYCPEIIVIRKISFEKYLSLPVLKALPQKLPAHKLNRTFRKKHSCKNIDYCIIYFFILFAIFPSGLQQLVSAPCHILFSSEKRYQALGQLDISMAGVYEKSLGKLSRNNSSKACY